MKDLQDAGSRDNFTESSATAMMTSKEIIIIRSPCLPVTIIAKPTDHQDYEDQDLEDHNYYGVYTTICSYNLQHLQNTSWCSQNAGVEGKSHDCDVCDYG